MQKFKASDYLTKEISKKFVEIIKNLEKDEYAYPFTKSEDESKILYKLGEDNLDTPLDLGEIKNKINNGHYKKVQEVIDDIFSIWAFWKEYYGENDSKYDTNYDFAVKMEKLTEKLLSKNFIFKNKSKRKNENGVQNADGNISSNDSTFNLMRVICNLSNEEIQTVNIYLQLD